MVEVQITEVVEKTKQKSGNTEYKHKYEPVNEESSAIKDSNAGFIKSVGQQVFQVGDIVNMDTVESQATLDDDSEDDSDE